MLSNCKMHLCQILLLVGVLCNPNQVLCESETQDNEFGSTLLDIYDRFSNQSNHYMKTLQSLTDVHEVLQLSTKVSEDDPNLLPSEEPHDRDIEEESESPTDDEHEDEDGFNVDDVIFDANDDDEEQQLFVDSEEDSILNVIEDEIDEELGLSGDGDGQRMNSVSDEEDKPGDGYDKFKNIKLILDRKGRRKTPNLFKQKSRPTRPSLVQRYWKERLERAPKDIIKDPIYRSELKKTTPSPDRKLQGVVYKPTTEKTKVFVTTKSSNIIEDKALHVQDRDPNQKLDRKLEFSSNGVENRIDSNVAEQDWIPENIEDIIANKVDADPHQDFSSIVALESERKLDSLNKDDHVASESALDPVGILLALDGDEKHPIIHNNNRRIEEGPPEEDQYRYEPTVTPASVSTTPATPTSGHRRRNNFHHKDGFNYDFYSGYFQPKTGSYYTYTEKPLHPSPQQDHAARTTYSPHYPPHPSPPSRHRSPGSRARTTFPRPTLPSRKTFPPYVPSSTIRPYTPPTISTERIVSSPSPGVSGAVEAFHPDVIKDLPQRGSLRLETKHEAISATLPPFTEQHNPTTIVSSLPAKTTPRPRPPSSKVTPRPPIQFQEPAAGHHPQLGRFIPPTSVLADSQPPSSVTTAKPIVSSLPPSIFAGTPTPAPGRITTTHSPTIVSALPPAPKPSPKPSLRDFPTPTPAPAFSFSLALANSRSPPAPFQRLEKAPLDKMPFHHSLTNNDKMPEDIKLDVPHQESGHVRGVTTPLPNVTPGIGYQYTTQHSYVKVQHGGTFKVIEDGNYPIGQAIDFFDASTSRPLTAVPSIPESSTFRPLTTTIRPPFLLKTLPDPQVPRELPRSDVSLTNSPSSASVLPASKPPLSQPSPDVVVTSFPARKSQHPQSGKLIFSPEGSSAIRSLPKSHQESRDAPLHISAPGYNYDPNHTIKLSNGHHAGKNKAFPEPRPQTPTENNALAGSGPLLSRPTSSPQPVTVSQLPPSASVEHKQLQVGPKPVHVSQLAPSAGAHHHHHQRINPTSAPEPVTVSQLPPSSHIKGHLKQVHPTLPPVPKKHDQAPPAAIVPHQQPQALVSSLRPQPRPNFSTTPASLQRGGKQPIRSLSPGGNPIVHGGPSAPLPPLNHSPVPFHFNAGPANSLPPPPTPAPFYQPKATPSHHVTVLPQLVLSPQPKQAPPSLPTTNPPLSPFRPPSGGSQPPIVSSLPPQDPIFKEAIQQSALESIHRIQLVGPLTVRATGPDSFSILDSNNPVKVQTFVLENEEVKHQRPERAQITKRPAIHFDETEDPFAKLENGWNGVRKRESTSPKETAIDRVEDFPEFPLSGQQEEIHIVRVQNKRPKKSIIFQDLETAGSQKNIRFPDKK